MPLLTPKSVLLISINGLRPKISTSHPVSGWKIVDANVQALVTRTYWVACSEREMLGDAVEMMLPSMVRVNPLRHRVGNRIQNLQLRGSHIGSFP